KKLAIRPVISTASGGNTTQKKYRSAFINSSSESSSGCFLIRLPAIRNLRSLDSTANLDKAGAAAIQARRLSLRSRSPCISRFERCALPAFPGGASHHAPHFPADPARRLLA